MNRVAIVDDDQEAIDALAVQTVDANMEPIPLTAGFQDLESAVEKIEDMADAALCDHRLFLNRYANFSGARLVAHLYRKSLPAILVTQFLDDSDVSIRKYRDKIPVLLTRDETNSETIRKGLSICQDELSGQHVLPIRKPWRALVRIEAVDQTESGNIVRAVVPGWNPCEQVRFPVDLIPIDIRRAMSRHLSRGDFYAFAQVNIGAEKPEDLYFQDFEPTLRQI